MAEDKYHLNSKLDFNKVEIETGKEVIENIDEEERKYLIECVKNCMCSEDFEGLTENELYNEIAVYLLLKEVYSKYEFFICRLSKRTANFLRRQAEMHGISTGRALENLLDGYPVDDPEDSAIMGVMNVNYITKKQTEEQKIRANFIIAGALINDIIETGKYTTDEALHETAKNLHEFKRIIEDIYKEEMGE